jgi:hypothetical protein
LLFCIFFFSPPLFPDDLPDRNCDKCTQCCVDYDGWLRFQSGLYKVVRDPLFDLLITLCIILNTMFLAMEHHGMSGSVRQALDIGNKVRAKFNLHKLITTISMAPFRRLFFTYLCISIVPELSWMNKCMFTIGSEFIHRLLVCLKLWFSGS